MSRVEWSRLGGDACEELLGVLLLRKYGTARRMRPSRGDGGIDIYIPKSDGWIVYQIKSFTGPLTTSRKQKIEKSWTTFRDFVAAHQIPVAAWYLLRPEDATWDDEQYLRGVVGDVPWQWGWKDLLFCESLAADYPDVIDYYLHDGKSRLERTVTAFLTAAGFRTTQGQAPATPAASTDVLMAVHDSINAIDPHYSYDFSVDTRPSSLADADDWWPPIAPTPDLVAAATSRTPDRQRAVTIRVFARYEQATEDREIPLSWSVSAEASSSDQKAYLDFINYGVQAARVPGQITVDLPGGLALHEAEGYLTFGPSTTGAPAELWTLSVLDESGSATLAEVDMRGGPPTSGLTGRGVSMLLQDVRGAVQLLWKWDEATAQVTYELTWNPLPGRLPRDLLPGLAVAAAFHQPNQVRLARTGGPTFAGPQSIAGEAKRELQELVELVRVLAGLQRHTHTPLPMPTADMLTPGVVAAWHAALRLLQGEDLHKPWTSLKEEYEVDVCPSIGEDVSVLKRLPLEIPTAEGLVRLGTLLVQAPARVSALEPTAEGRTRATLVPTGDRLLHLKVVDDEDLQDAAIPH